MKDKLNRKKFIVIGSGPSLSWDDLEHIGNYANYKDYAIVCVNNTYQFSDWIAADYLFASDLKWWRGHYDEVVEMCDDDEYEFCTLNSIIPQLKKTGHFLEHIGFEHHKDESQIGVDDSLYYGYCSGNLAVEMCRVLGAEQIILTGFDYQHTNDMKHYFGDHPKCFSNAAKPERWVEHFDKLMPVYETLGIDVVNCTRETAIESCRKADIKEVITE